MARKVNDVDVLNGAFKGGARYVVSQDGRNTEQLGERGRFGMGVGPSASRQVSQRSDEPASRRDCASASPYIT
jgi:hypothetical protein